MIQLFRSELVDVGGVEAAAVFGAMGVRVGQPFVLGPDGAYDVALNQFFRQLPEWGVRSKNGIEAYVRDLMLF